MTTRNTEMLKRFWVNNFMSLMDFEFRPAAVNLLIGPNNAGKSNLLIAMRFLALTSQMSLERAARAIGRLGQLTNSYNTSNEMQFEIEFELGSTRNFLYRLELVNITDSMRNYILVSAEKLVSNNEIIFQRSMDEEESPHDYMETFIFNWYLRFDHDNHGEIEILKDYLSRWSYFNFHPGFLKSSKVIANDSTVRSEGENFVKALYTCHNESPKLIMKIINTIKLLDPKFDIISFKTFDPNDVIYLNVEDDEGRKFNSQSISDGTWRFMALAYLIITENYDKDLPSLIMIEEPDNGLYVGYLKELLQKIDPEGSRGQYIFTAHNPYFIDLFDNNIEGIHVFKPGKPSSILTKPDPERVQRLLEKMPLGEMHFRELLG